MKRSLRMLVTVCVMGLLGSGCSLVLNLSECGDDSECPDGICSEDGLCVAEEVQGCEDDTDCPGDQTCNELGACQEPSSLLGEPCTQSVGEINDEDAFLIGVLLPLSGPEEDFGRPLFNAIRLGQSDFNGIGGVLSRDIALIVCDTQGLDDRARAGAEHLAAVGVQAVIGPDYSSQTIDVATNVTIPAEMVLVSPSATAVTISNLDDNGLVWRTVASDAVQGAALGELVNFLLDDQPLAVLARADDTYAAGLRQALIDRVPASVISDDALFTTYDYPNAAAGQGSDYSTVVGNLLAEDPAPGVVVILGAAEAWTIATLLDDEWDHDPIFVFADAARNIGEASTAPSSLLGRVWGTAPQNVGDSGYAPYLGFRVKYQGAYGERPDNFQFVANAFDALYVIALGAAGGGFDGPGIAEGMTRLSDGQSVEPNQAAAQSAMNTLSQGGSVNYRGASGELNFDENGDPQASPIVLWCFDDPGLPTPGVVMDANLQFSPQQCGLELECEENSDCTAGPEGSDGACNVDGVCEYQCPSALTLCTDVCADLGIDMENCGECGRFCDEDTEICEAGECVDN